MRNFYSVAILLTLAVVCTAKPTTSKKGCIAADFYIGETVATTPIACHNDKTIAARYFHICDIKYHFMECPAVKKCLKKHGIKARSENNLEDNEHFQGRDTASIFLDSIAKRGAAQDFNKLKSKCCKSKNSPNTCTDDYIRSTCPGGANFSKGALHKITDLACEITIEEAINEG